ncbi:unnamed protein product [Fraxinus pennsylvanica]|uniref:Protein kinase domain-containing protein n=1 Tax=Fraxinus pennsylvanica TaxID=56036 RepID=A0AAD2A3C4_9LAMI|nr:unnamed protein product [Fraxinus pennsylvanica]
MGSKKKLLLALITASTAMRTIILFLLCFWVYHRKYTNKSKEKRGHSSDVAKGLALSQLRFLGKYNTFKTSCRNGSVTTMEYMVLESATNNFSENEILGVGGFGCVYKAKLEENLSVAVKRLHGGTSDAIREFGNEVELLSNIQHPNIISLLGCSIHAEIRLLVFELMQNGSLESQLHVKLIDKSDVYAFGVVLLELLLGRKPVEKLALAQCQSIVTWAMPQLNDRSKLPNIVDLVIRNTMDLKHLYQVAVLCIQLKPSYRPLITDVLHSLIPLVPMELGGTLRIAKPEPPAVATMPSNN